MGAERINRCLREAAEFRPGTTVVMHVAARQIPDAVALRELARHGVLVDVWAPDPWTSRLWRDAYDGAWDYLAPMEAAA